MDEVPQDLSYSSEHTWVNAESPAKVGITNFAQSALGDIIYVELPNVGDRLTHGSIFGELESTKSVSELYAPVSGTITAINDAAVKDPSLINTDPYGAGWLVEVEVTDRPAELLNAADYATKTN